MSSSSSSLNNNTFNNNTTTNSSSSELENISLTQLYQQHQIEEWKIFYFNFDNINELLCHLNTKLQNIKYQYIISLSAYKRKKIVMNGKVRNELSYNEFSNNELLVSNNNSINHERDSLSIPILDSTVHSDEEKTNFKPINKNLKKLMGPITSTVTNLTPLIDNNSDNYLALLDEEIIDIDFNTINDPKIIDDIKHSDEYIELVTALEIEIERINTFYYRTQTDLCFDFEELERQVKRSMDSFNLTPTNSIFQKEETQRLFDLQVSTSPYLNKPAFFHLYRQETLLFYFAKLNHVGLEDALCRLDIIVNGKKEVHDIHYYTRLFMHKYDAIQKTKPQVISSLPPFITAPMRQRSGSPFGGVSAFDSNKMNSNKLNSPMYRPKSVALSPPVTLPSTVLEHFSVAKNLITSMPSSPALMPRDADDAFNLPQPTNLIPRESFKAALDDAVNKNEKTPKNAKKQHKSKKNELRDSVLKKSHDTNSGFADLNQSSYSEDNSTPFTSMAFFFDDANWVLAPLIKKTLELYANSFECGDEVSAKIHLLSSVNDASLKLARRDVMRIGIKIGLLIPLFFWILVDIITQHVQEPDIFTTSDARLAAAPIYRFIGILLIAGWLWGVSVWVWNKNRINYVYIFQFDPRTTLTHFEIFEEMASISFIYMLSLIMYMKTLDPLSPFQVSYIPSYVFPFAMLVTFFLKLAGPARFFSKANTRWFMFNSLYNIMIAPFGSVHFMDLFLGDLLTSMPKVFVDMERGLCFYFSGSWFDPTRSLNNVIVTASVSPSCTIWDSWVSQIISVLPFWFRFAQCLRRYKNTNQTWPHLGNAVKYSICSLVLIVGALHPGFLNSNGQQLAESFGSVHRIVWLALTVCSALYTWWWDVNMDWGLVGFQIRENRTFAKFVYVIAIVGDIILRFSWSISILPSSLNPFFGSSGSVGINFFYYDVGFLPGIMAAEIFRRFCWAILRVEYEHSLGVESFSQSDYVPNYTYLKSSLKEREDSSFVSIAYDIGSAIVLIGILSVIIYLTYI